MIKERREEKSRVVGKGGGGEEWRELNRGEEVKGKRRKETAGEEDKGGEEGQKRE